MVSGVPVHDSGGNNRVTKAALSEGLEVCVVGGTTARCRGVMHFQDA